MKHIGKLLSKWYGLSNVSTVPLDGYNSANYKVQEGKSTYVLKVYPRNEDTLELLLSENRILSRLTSLKTYDFPAVLPNLQGDALTLTKRHILRLLTFLEGDFLGSVSHPPELLKSFGTFLGSVDRELEGLRDATLAAREYPWDLQHMDRSKRYLANIPDPSDRSLVDYFIMQFEQRVFPKRAKLRKGIIHNDANVWNVLTSNDRITGLIDFGDMCYTWIICELAVGLAYLMMDKDDPLEICREVISSYHQVEPLKKTELELLYYLIAGRLCISVCNSAYAKIKSPESEYITISEKGAWKLLRKMLSISPMEASNAFMKAAGYSLTPTAPPQDDIKRRNRFLSTSFSLSYQAPIRMKQAAFQYMYDTEGHTFLDAYNNIMLAGHCHPKIVRAGQKMMSRLNTNTRYLYDELADYSEKLLARFPHPLTKVFFVNSGSAASDLALRLATGHTKRDRIMVLEHGYHGHTMAAIDASHYKYNHKGGRKRHIIQLPLPKVFRSGFPDAFSAANHYSEITLKNLERNAGKIAAFIAEPIVGCGGQVPLAPGYLKNIYPEIRRSGGLCISDEVQVGFGRLGDHFWGFEMHGIVPDLVVIGKPMGNGHPIGAVVTTDAIAKSFEEGPEFFSSFGGNPVSCAIGKAVLEVIEEEKLQEHARKTGNHLIKGLKELQQKVRQIADIRGSGLFLGVELEDEDGRPATHLAAKIKNGLRAKHILIGTDGPADNVLKIKPPLSFTIENSVNLTTSMMELFTDS